jgi:hypothetical protein
MIEKYFDYSVLMSCRSSSQFIQDNMFLRDRKDIYILDVDNLVDFYDSPAYRFTYYLLEMKVNPDFDW